MIHVQQRTLRTLEQDALALATLQVEQSPHRFSVRQKLGSKQGQFLQDDSSVDIAKLEAAAQRVVMRQQAIDLVGQRIQIGEVHEANRAATNLVFISRSNAAPRGAD